MKINSAMIRFQNTENSTPSPLFQHAVGTGLFASINFMNELHRKRYLERATEDAVRKFQGDEGVHEFRNRPENVSPEKMFMFLLKKETLKIQIDGFIKHIQMRDAMLPDRGCIDNNMLKMTEFLKKLRDNPAAWTYEKFDKTKRIANHLMTSIEQNFRLFENAREDQYSRMRTGL